MVGSCPSEFSMGADANELSRSLCRNLLMSILGSVADIYAPLVLPAVFYNNLCHLVICPADTLEVVSANGLVGGGMTRAFDGLFAGLVRV